MTTQPPRASIWLGLAQLILPREYNRIEEIRALRQERKKKQKTEAETKAAAVDNETSGEEDVAVTPAQ
ncbi:hypothetical protein H2204_001203 [Knufia peltigerae]|nr:hypothetical protein H2204_001203 [Knufia peltigerae]